MTKLFVDLTARKLRAARDPFPAAGHVLSALTGEPGQLPVRIGDTLTPGTIEATIEAVRFHDTSLTVRIVSLPDGTARIEVTKSR